MAEFTKQNKYRSNVERFMSYAMNIKRTPMGLTWKAKWGPNRYAGILTILLFLLIFKQWNKLNKLLIT